MKLNTSVQRESLSFLNYSIPIIDFVRCCQSYIEFNTGHSRVAHLIWLKMYGYLMYKSSEQYSFFLRVGKVLLESSLNKCLWHSNTVRMSRGSFFEIWWSWLISRLITSCILMHLLMSYLTILFLTGWNFVVWWENDIRNPCWYCSNSS